MRVLSIVPNDELRRELEAGLKTIPGVQVARSLSAFPDLDELLRGIRVHVPDCLILSVEEFSKIEGLLNNVDSQLPGLPMVAVAGEIDEQLVLHLMRLGVRECLVAPITREKLVETVSLLEKQRKKHPTPVSRPADLYSFFPAKPGVGTTTVALSVSCALAEDLSIPTLLMDCDLAAGIVRFHLKLANTTSILDALRHGENLDEDMWRQLVGHWHKLDTLHAGELNAVPHINLEGFPRLLAMARAQYEVVCADLASDLNEFSIELLRESRRIFLVTTPEIAALHLAQVRVKSFTELGVTDRVSLVLNRKDHWHGHLDPAEAAQAVGMPVSYVIGNDYNACTDALVRASGVPTASDIGKSIIQLAQSLSAECSKKPLSPADRGHRFLEFFHISQAGDPTMVWRD